MRCGKAILMLVMQQTYKHIEMPQSGQEILFLQTAADTGGQLLEMVTAYRPGSGMPPLHYHPAQTEDFKVMEGELTVHISGKQFTVGAGECFHVPPGTVHGMWNGSRGRTVVSWKVRPALDTQDFLEAIAALNLGDTGAGGKRRLLQFALVLRRYTAVFRLARPSYRVQQLVFALLGAVAKTAAPVKRNFRW